MHAERLEPYREHRSVIEYGARHHMQWKKAFFARMTVTRCESPLPLLEEAPTLTREAVPASINRGVSRKVGMSRQAKEKSEHVLLLMSPPQNLTVTHPAKWQTGHAAACIAVYAGSVPTSGSIDCYRSLTRRPRLRYKFIESVPTIPCADPRARVPQEVTCAVSSDR